MRITDFVRGGARARAAVPGLAMDPLRESGALQEAQVVDLRFDAVGNIVVVLFELRQALQLDEGNTAVLVADGVCGLSWSGPPRETVLTAWPILGSVPSIENGLFTLTAFLWPNGHLAVTAEQAAFFVGDVPGLPEAPPDYTDATRDDIDSGLAGWSSSFTLAGATFLNARL